MQRSLPVCLSLLSLILISSSSLVAAADKPNKLLVLLIDGFRWDYFNKFAPGELPGFERLRRNGVSPVAFVPVFPSLSFVNYYSIMTGTYAETNGMIDNYMYDVKHDKEFLIGDNPDQFLPFWWDDGEPLWITAVKQGKRAYMWYWNGCEVEIRGSRPTFCSPYQLTPDPSFANFSLGLQQAVAVLRNDSADFAGVYLEQVDAEGHRLGPDGDGIKPTILAVDAELVKLQDMIANDKNINLILFSDHGMAQRVGGVADGWPGMINVCNYVNCATDWQHAYGSKTGPVLQIWPWPNNTEWMYNTLKKAHPNLTVYKREDIPEHYHLKNHYRMPPIYLVADKGYAIARNPLTRNLTTVGFHGYDNAFTDVHGILFVSGPDFKRNSSFGIGRLPNVNLYALMCHVMQLVPAPNNGTWSAVCDALADPAACTKGAWTPPVSGSSRMTSGCGVGAMLAVAVAFITSRIAG